MIQHTLHMVICGPCCIRPRRTRNLTIQPAAYQRVSNVIAALGKRGSNLKSCRVVGDNSNNKFKNIVAYRSYAQSSHPFHLSDSGRSFRSPELCSQHTLASIGALCVSLLGNLPRSTNKSTTQRCSPRTRLQDDYTDGMSKHFPIQFVAYV
jgi:hypothetical protein